jgi:hypothetical protein
LKQLEHFPFYAFKMASATEISVRLDDKSVDYPVIRGERELLPLNPIPSLKKLDFSFTRCSSILAYGEHLTHLFPSLTDLSLLRGGHPIAVDHLEALPSTLRRLRLSSSPPSAAPHASLKRAPKPITLALLSKISQNLELLHLDHFQIALGPGESVSDFRFPDSILDLFLARVLVTEIVTKLPRYVERVEIACDVRNSSQLPDVPLSVLPETLRKLRICGALYCVPFILDGVFPARLEELDAHVKWDLAPAEFSIPNSLQIVNCDGEVLSATALEKASKSLRAMNMSYTHIDAVRVLNFPPSLLSLEVTSIDPQAMTLLLKASPHSPFPHFRETSL